MKYGAGAACALMLLASPAFAAKPPLEMIFKSDSNLAALDRQLNMLYGSLMLSLDADKQKALRTGQREWVKQRNKDYAASSEYDEPEGLQSAYDDRVAALKEQLRALQTIPVEAFFKYPALWDEIDSGRFTPEIKATVSLHDIPAFTNLTRCLGGLESGRWVTTSYMQWAGTIYRDIDGGILFIENEMSFAPQRIPPETVTVEENLAPLVAWSYEGIWNRKSYQACEAQIKPAADAIGEYYRKNYHLVASAKRSMELLAGYIGHRDGHNNDIVVSPAFSVLRDKTPSLDALKVASKEFKPVDWNIALAMALLNKSSAETIEWLLASGADVNAPVHDETPLMRAVEQPEIEALLLKKGAKTEAETPYGKTALFYAVRYDQLETVKLLLGAGADVNHPIKTLKEIEATYMRAGGESYLVEKVAEFTPLVYSEAYASPEVTDYLKNKGATEGKADPKIIKDWVKENTPPAK